MDFFLSLRTNFSRFVVHQQGDQIGRISAHWGIVFSFKLGTKVGRISVQVTQLLWQKNGLGYILGDFFTHSSGRPVHHEQGEAGPSGQVNYRKKFLSFRQIDLRRPSHDLVMLVRTYVLRPGFNKSPEARS
jgi:hypothetical protein